jgi:hypothetical protein
MTAAGELATPANHASDMSYQELRDLLERVEDTRELVLLDISSDRPDPEGELHAVWREAARAAEDTYADWRARPDRSTFASYRAAADRADAAQDALWLDAARRALAHV